ncbi:unnamed protein product [Mytilus coruscus]|uniref:Core-binding (CB) domain-containing protein n=1 Tax=Mytilus coruscus TaxID=42192 RepID=A0A6J7ZZ32_MYTCO|nr:unnamed protein product [Mytilus coruscus]
MEVWLLCVSTSYVSPSFNTGLSNGSNQQLHGGKSSISGASSQNIGQRRTFTCRSSGNCAHSRCKLICDYDPPLKSLKDEADLLLKWSMASNSWKTYKTAEECFKKFRIIYNYFDIWPVPIDEIALYIAYLSYEGLSASTVSTYISELAYTHKIHNVTDNTKSFIICEMMEGLRRKNPQKIDVRTLISLNLLKRLIHSLRSVCYSHYETILTPSTFSLAYFAMLRISEIAINSLSDECRHALNYKDVTFSKSNSQIELHVKIYSSKTDQKHNSVTLIIQRHADSNICPIQLLQSYLQVRFSGVNGSNKLYTHLNGLALTKYQFYSLLQKC